MKDLLFIYNPITERIIIKRNITAALNFFSSNGYITTVLSTQYANHAFKYLTTLHKKYDRVIVCGGHEIVNQVISGIIIAPNEPLLGCIPSTANYDFARDLGIPYRFEKALEISIGKNYNRIDVGEFNKKHFTSMAAFGPFTNMPYNSKNLLNYLTYILDNIKLLSELKSYDVIVDYDNGHICGEFIAGLVINSHWLGNLKSPFETLTQLNDGLFELVLIRTPENILELHSMINSLIDNCSNSSNILCIQTSKIHIESQKIAWTLDGVYEGELDIVNIQNRNKAIRILVDRT